MKIASAPSLAGICLLALRHFAPATPGNGFGIGDDSQQITVTGATLTLLRLALDAAGRRWGLVYLYDPTETPDPGDTYAANAMLPGPTTPTQT